MDVLQARKRTQQLLGAWYSIFDIDDKEIYRKFMEMESLIILPPSFIKVDHCDLAHF